MSNILKNIIKCRYIYRRNVMRTIAEYFNGVKEETPKWLKEYKKGDKPTFKEIFNAGRIVYYPGAGYDGQPIKTFNIAHYAHAFFYVDYGISREQILEALTDDHALNGYKNIGIIEYQEKDMSPHGWKRHYTLTPEEMREMESLHISSSGSYCLVFVFEREANLTDEHGCDRFAVITLKGDAIATYDALFVNNNKVPDVLILQDHGYGCNYNCFGRGGALNQIADAVKQYPPYMMVADGTRPWKYYDKIPNLHHALSTSMRWLYNFQQEKKDIDDPLYNFLVNNNNPLDEEIKRLARYRGIRYTIEESDIRALIKKYFSKDSVPGTCSFFNGNYEVWTKCFASSTLADTYVDPLMLDPFIARYIIAINKIGIKTCFSCDGWHTDPKKNKIVIIFKEHYSKVYHKVIYEKYSKHYLMWNYNEPGNAISIWLPKEDDSKLEMYDCINKDAEFFEENEERLFNLKKELVKKLKGRSKNNLNNDQIERLFKQTLKELLRYN